MDDDPRTVPDPDVPALWERSRSRERHRAAARLAEDDWLVGHARRGDLEAFEVLAARHQDRIFRIALRMLGDSQEAEDLTQDVLVQLWTRLVAFAGTSTFSTWLHRLVVNRCLNRLKQRRRTEQVPAADEPGHPHAQDTAGRVQDQARLDAAARAVAALPESLRVVFVLYQLEGLSYQEIATVQKLSEQTVRGRLARARAGVADAMKEWL